MSVDESRGEDLACDVDLGQTANRGNSLASGIDAKDLVLCHEKATTAGDLKTLRGRVKTNDGATFKKNGRSSGQLGRGIYHSRGDCKPGKPHVCKFLLVYKGYFGKDCL
jgi:hypothetical protein